MIPLLIQLGPLPIYTFGLMVALALLAGTLRLQRSFERFDLDPRFAERYVMYGGVSGIIGARLWFIGEHINEMRGDLVSSLLANAGFTFYGGFIIAAVVVTVRVLVDKVPLAVFVDALGPTLALGYAIGRIGCQLSGDGDYGIPVAGPLGMSYATGVVPTPPGLLVYPTPMYESFLAVLIAFILLRLESLNPKFLKPGWRFGVYLILISIERFWIEFIRPNERIYSGLSEAQIIAAMMGILGLVLVGVRYGRGRAAIVS